MGRTLLLLLLIGGGLYFVRTNRASEVPTLAQSAEHAASNIYLSGSNFGQFFDNDLEVTARNSIDGDATVYSGDVTVKEGGDIHGDLLVYSGDIKIEHGGTVHGNVTAFSGDIELDGLVHGNLSAASGDINLTDSAVVEGDVSVLAGDISRDKEAVVRGNIINGPNITLPKMPALPGINADTQIDVNIQDNVNVQDDVNVNPDARTTTSSWAGWFGRIILGIVGSVLAIGLVTVASTGVTRWRPGYIDQVRETMESQLPLSFAFGFMANLPLIGMIALFRLLFCLTPMAILLLLVFLAINVPGWAAVSQVVGKRFAKNSRLSNPSSTTAALGALVISTPIVLLWMAGGCLSFIGFILMLLVSSPGSGAVLLPWVRKLSGSQLGGDQDLAVAPYNGGTSTVDSTAEEVVETAPPSAAAEEMSQTENVADLFAELDAMRSATGERDTSADDNAPAEDDFTRIDGIGRIFDRRFKDVGITTFAQLASLTPEQVSAIIGWSASRVERDDLLGQARRLAEAAE